ncbi:MAG TPA: DNA-binding protein [Phycisphaerales bacterium]|nr:DNA-binding protein [Phycisphaerales bacterium]
MGKEQDLISFEEAAKWCNTSATTIWEAAESGLLLAEKNPVDQSWRVRLDDLERWAKCENHPFNRPEFSPQHENETEQELLEDEATSLSFHIPNSEAPDWADFQERLLDRLEHAQRRSVVLELQLRQTQKLLCESNDSKLQHEAELKAAQAQTEAAEKAAREARDEIEQANSQAEVARQEAARAKIELESLKTEMSAKEAQWAEMRKPWYKKLFRAV